MVSNSDPVKSFEKDANNREGKPLSYKPRAGLLPPRALMAVARVLEHGARKYAPNNWARAPTWSVYYDAAMRHFLAWLTGEDVDADTKESHLAHLACCILFLLEFIERGNMPALDDRFRVEEEKDPRVAEMEEKIRALTQENYELKLRQP